MGLIESLKWRYATKKFNTTEKVKSADLEVLKEAIRLTATSYGLQPFKVIIIDSQPMKEQLTPATFGQAQASDCSHLFVFANVTAVTAEYIDNYIELCASERNLEVSNLAGYSTFMKTTLAEYSESQITEWGTKQAYIAMSNLLTACAHLRIDACPIEGFDSKSYNKILDLDSKDLSACVVVAVGYRSEDDANQHLKKVRLAAEDLFL